MIENIINPLNFPGDPRVAHIITAVLVQLLGFLAYGGVISISLFWIKPASKRNRVIGKTIGVIVSILAGALQAVTFCKFFGLDKQAISLVWIVFIVLDASIAFHLYNPQTGGDHGTPIRKAHEVPDREDQA